MSYFNNVENVDRTFSIVDAMKKGRPIIVFKIQNYHYELRTRRVAHTTRDANGNTRTEWRTETYWERVNTHYAETPYIYS
mmetsp:Transcript_3761/g.3680  ORF Transcript_3761/g.3680 Transcript_3761/m.3680 type:complete len:80 (+) Transcript_3761:1098-1337(+)